MIEIKVPAFGESIQEVQISNWLKNVNDWVKRDDEIVELETEKASQAVPTPESGFIRKILVANGAFAKVGQVLALLEPANSPAGGGDNAAPPKQASAASVPNGTPNSSNSSTGSPTPMAGSSQTDNLATNRATSNTSSPKSAPAQPSVHGSSGEGKEDSHGPVMPAAERLMAEHGIRPQQLQGTGPGGRILKEDVTRFVQSNLTQAQSVASGLSAANQTSALNSSSASSNATQAAAGSTPSSAGKTSEHNWDDSGDERKEDVRPMSMIRRTIATRLVEAQQSAALLTTFNEIDMFPVMELRSRYKDPFQEKHGVKLGFMSFFAKATVEALKRFPAVNAEVRGTDVVYRNYFDIGIAIGGGKGLVVPILRNVQRMSFADIERRIGQYAELAKTNKLKPADLEGGTFTISNGGVYGSLLSTPIVNPPQSGILGLHSIQDRPIAKDGQVVIRPMMYIALTHDHRIVDGREAVGFLKTIKEVLEEPARLFLEV